MQNALVYRFNNEAKQLSIKMAFLAFRMLHAAQMKKTQ